MYNIQPKALFVGKNVIYLPTCHSTNTLAGQMIQNEAVADGTIVITSNQTAGRGQRGNSWETLPGQNITASFILKPTFLTATEQFNLNIAVSLAVHEFLSPLINSNDSIKENFKTNPENLGNHFNPDLKIKWPNDIYVGDKKLGGILIENTLSGSQIAYSVIGIGLNINQLEFGENRATSLRIFNPQTEFDIEKLVEKLAESLEKHYLELRNGYANRQKERYLQILYRYQERHYFEEDDVRFLGTIIGVAKDGRLAIEVGGAVEYFEFKGVRFVI